MSSTFRKTFDDLSVPALKRLEGLPRVVPILVVLGLLVAGAFIPGWGWVLTALVLLFLLWMLAHSWPQLTSSERLMRVAVLVFIAAITVVQALPRT